MAKVGATTVFLHCLLMFMLSSSLSPAACTPRFFATRQPPGIPSVSSKNGTKLTQEMECNPTPVIGLLSQEYSSSSGTSFMMKSGKDFIAQAGVRVVPVFVGREPEYYHDLMTKINGVLLPGGGIALDKLLTSPNGRAVQIMVKESMRMYDTTGAYFPVWGICQGFETLVAVVANTTNVLQKCTGMEVGSLRTQLAEGVTQWSRMFANAPDRVVDALENKPVAVHLHGNCLSSDAFRANPKLSESLRSLATNHEADGGTLETVSIIESTRYPIFAVQFHPEKNNFWFSGSFHHGDDATFVSQFFANFLANEARKSCWTYPSKDELDTSLLDNYPLTFGPDSGYNGMYIFK